MTDHPLRKVVRAERSRGTPSSEAETALGSARSGPSTSLGANGGRFADKGGTFAAAATRLAGLTAVLLGWRPDEFWQATPAELEAVLTAFATPPTAASAPPDAATIAALKERFPDG